MNPSTKIYLLPSPPACPREFRILYAEDDPLLSDMVKRMLGTQGWQVTCVSDGEKAIQACDGKEFDLILLDIQMPRVNGFDAARAIRAQEKNSRIPIMALTASGNRDNCLAAGMDGILTKPFRMSGLIQAILQLMNGRSAHTSPAGAVPSGLMQ